MALPRDRFRQRHNFVCHACHHIIGERVSAGLKMDNDVVFHPRQSFTCRCRTNFKSVSLAFAMADAQEKGLGSVIKVEEGKTVVHPEMVDWDLFKELNQHGLLVVHREQNAIILVARPARSPMDKAGESIVNNVLASEEMTVEEKRHLLQMGLQALEPFASEAPQENVQEAAQEALTPAEATATIEAHVEAKAEEPQAKEPKAEVEGPAPEPEIPAGLPVRPLDDEPRKKRR